MVCSKAFTAVALPVGLLALAGCSKVVAKAGEVPLQRNDIEVSVYKDDFAVVKEVRPVSLAAGTNRLGLTGVSKSLDPDSVIYNWQDHGQHPQVESTSYDLGVSESGHLLQRFLGQQVELVRFGQDGKESERVKGILEVADPGNIVLNVDGKYLINPAGTIEAPGNTGIVTIPQLSVEVASPAQQRADLAVTYLTAGLSWSADYVAKLSPDSDTMALETWASITNKTGTDFPNAKISFVAGAPNRSMASMTLPAASAPYAESRMMKRAAHVSNDGQMQIAQAAPAGELYTYPMTSTATIVENQSSRVRMLGSDRVEVKKDYSIAMPELALYSFDEVSHARHSATLAISFKNTAANGLGMPLPAGAVRVYEPSATGSLTYIGADDLSDTPKDSGTFLTLSNVFDVYGQSRIAAVHKVKKHVVDADLVFTLTNQKKSAVTLRLVQPIEGKWKMITEDAKSTRPNASTVQWLIQLKPGQELKLNAKVEFTG